MFDAMLTNHGAHAKLSLVLFPYEYSINFPLSTRYDVEVRSMALGLQLMHEDELSDLKESG